MGDKPVEIWSHIVMILRVNLDERIYGDEPDGQLFFHLTKSWLSKDIYGDDDVCWRVNYLTPLMKSWPSKEIDVIYERKIVDKTLLIVDLI